MFHRDIIYVEAGLASGNRSRVKSAMSSSCEGWRGPTMYRSNRSAVECGCPCTLHAGTLAIALFSGIDEATWYALRFLSRFAAPYG